MREAMAGAAVHVWQRGNHQEAVFGGEGERRLFVGILLRQCHWYGARLEAYCLMTNHYHLVMVGRREDSVERAVGCTAQAFAAFRQRREGVTGHLWERRYGSKVLDEAHYWAALCYVERNPVEAGMVERAWDWPWSSAQARLGLASDYGLDLRRWRDRYDEESWRRALEVGIYDAAIEERAFYGKFRNQREIR